MNSPQGRKGRQENILFPTPGWPQTQQSRGRQRLPQLQVPRRANGPQVGTRAHMCLHGTPPPPTGAGLSLFTMNPPGLPLPPSQPPAWGLGTEQPHQFIRGRQPHRAVWGINQTMRRKRKEKREREREVVRREKSGKGVGRKSDGRRLGGRV